MPERPVLNHSIGAYYFAVAGQHAHQSRERVGRALPFELGSFNGRLAPAASHMRVGHGRGLGSLGSLRLNQPCRSGDL